jgi:rhodanese-related sulfurtransferase
MRLKTLMLALVMIFAFSTLAFAQQEVYPTKGKHKGGNVTPIQAYKMLQADPEHTFLVDVRTRYEYQDIGHPVQAYNIPWKFYNHKIGKKGYKKDVNKNFGKDLRARFNPETDTLLLLCRSAARTIAASTAAVDAGFKPDKVFNVLGGFEGDKIKDKTSPFYGKRMLGGWRLEGLPWTYKMNPELLYQPDLAAMAQK